MDDAALQMTMTVDDVTRRAAVIAVLSATESRSERALAKAVTIWGKETNQTHPRRTWPPPCVSGWPVSLHNVAVCL
ncbi:hypothetical protein EI94DRAFT_1752189 [Lactarius quietus]|nr:hypothetical protein EI94DRAFT_1752189 [Lactarius quietus]